VQDYRAVSIYVNVTRLAEVSHLCHIISLTVTLTRRQTWHLQREGGGGWGGE
jgi:hypothetical protein